MKRETTMMLIHFEIDRKRYFIFMGHNLGGIIIKQVRIIVPFFFQRTGH